MDDKYAQFQRILKEYQDMRQPGDQQMLLALLGETQDLFGYLPQNVQIEIAEAMGTTPALVSALIKRIPRLKGGPYRHQITVCIGPRCSAKKGKAVLRQIQQLIKPSAEGNTSDGRFHLATRICMKHCPTAPNLMVDGDLYPQVSLDDIPSILAKYL